MKKIFFFALLIAAIAGTTFSSFAAQPDPLDCGALSIGNFKVDLGAGKTSMEIPRTTLADNFNKGLTFAGTSDCPGAYEIVDLHLTIDGEREAKYEYNYDFVRKMQSMEDYMLVRYFNDALKLTFTNIKVKNSSGEIMDVPSVVFTVKS